MTARLMIAGVSLFARRVLGLRAGHVYGAALAATALVVLLAPPFWWLGEQAYGTAGILGALLVGACYLAAAAAALAAFTLLLARFVLIRARRTFGAR